MIPIFVLQAAAIALPDLDPVQKRLRTLEFVKLWLGPSVLMHGDCLLEESALLREIEALPQGLRTIWGRAVTAAKSRRLLRRGPRSWPGDLKSIANLERSALAGTVNLALVSRELLASVVDGEEQYKMTDAASGIEICRLDSAAHSDAFRQLEGLRSCIRDSGYRVDTIWTEFFKPLVEFSCAVIVVDRFAVTSHCNRRDGKSGLARFLRGVSAADGKRLVRIFSAVQPDQTIDQSRQAIESLLVLQKYSGFDFELFMLPDEQFREVFHFRYVRFDAMLQVKTDVGLQVLEGDTLMRPANIQVQAIERELPMLEQRCLAACRSKPVLKRLANR